PGGAVAENRWPRWYSQPWFQTGLSASSAGRSDGVSWVFRSPDRTTSLCSSKPRPWRRALALRQSRSGGGRDGGCGSGAVVSLAADHQLPGDAGGLVSECYSGQLGRLALEQLGQPGRGLCASALDVSDVGGGAAVQPRTEGLVAGPRDAAVLLLAATRMILGGEADPGGTAAAGAEDARVRDLDRQQTGADRTDGGHLRQAPTELVRAMPGHQLGLECGDLWPELAELPAEGHEHLLGQRRNAAVVIANASQ